MDEARLRGVIDAAYDSAVAPDRWPVLLGRLAGLFDSQFADAFARTQDRSIYRGLAFGLDRADYEDEFLGTWVKRNVWGNRRPVRDAGEIISTRQMVTKAELMRSEMYSEYLAPRGLHEGMRLSIWTSDDWIQDISLLRPWSAGQFGPAEMALAGVLMPHLQRAAAIARRLGETAALSQAGFAALDALDHAAFLLDDAGRVMLTNRAADRLLSKRDGVAMDAVGLLGATPAVTAAMRRVVGQAGGASGQAPVSGRLLLPRPSGALPLALIATPLGITLGLESGWGALRRPSVLVMIGQPFSTQPAAPTPLAELFDLTAAEARLAAELMAGRTVVDIAARSNRSVNTMRTHLARLMAKTGTRRQNELLHLLMCHKPAASTADGPRFS